VTKVPIPLLVKEKRGENVTKGPPQPLPLPTATKAAADTIRKLLLDIDPNLHLYETPPRDALAQQVKNGWKRGVPAIPLLVQGGAYRSFLINIAKAIQVTFAPSYVVEVEREENWDLFLQSPNLKFIISPNRLIFSVKELLPFYKEYPNKNVCYLGDIPLLFLPDLSLYYKSPYLKRSLWNMITQNLQPLF